MVSLTSRPLCLLVAALSLAAVAAAAQVPHVHNGDRPRDGVATLNLVEQWRIGGPDDEENIFGVVNQVLRGEDGNIYVLDTQLCQVAVFSPSGERLRTLSREGDGPGEIRNPDDMFFLPDGRLAMIQLFPGKLVVVDREGNPAGSFVPGGTDAATAGFGVLVRGYCDGERVGLTGIRQTFDQGILHQTRYLTVYDGTGAEITTLLTKETTVDFSQPVLDEEENDFVWTRWGFLPGGGIVVAPERNAYRLEFHAPDGTLLRTCDRDYAPLPRDERELARQRAMLEAQGRFYPTPPKVVVAGTEPDIVWMHTRPDGEVWVLTGRGTVDQPDGVLLTYDVFDTSGVFVRQVAVRGEGNAREDMLFPLDDDLAVLVTDLRSAAMAAQGAGDDGEAEPMEIVLYRLER